MLEYFNKMQKDFNFEVREGQINMANIIRQSINENKSCVIEAGTGVGKTLAYLLPSILYASKNNKKVVVSTNTINLQEQIVEKDLPMLEKIIGEKIKYQIIKGRSNYICGNRLLKNSTNDKLIEWYQNTKTGDRQEIDFELSNEEWNNVCCDIDYCVNFACSKTDNCFFYKNRKKTQDKNVLIVNHSLLFSSLKFEGILPKYDILVIDEAHNIENIARAYLEKKINSKNFLTNMGILYNRNTKMGYLRRLITELSNLSDGQKEIDDIFSEMSDVLNSIYDFFVNLTNYLVQNIYATKKYSIREVNISSKIPKYYEYVEIIKEKYILLEEFKNNLLKLTNKYSVSEDILASFFMIYDKISLDLKNLFEINENKDSFESVNWFKLDNIGYNLEIVSSKIDISEEFDEIFSDKLTVLTSATLKVDDSYDYLKKRLGLRDFEFYSVESPFDYDKNMRIIVSKNNFNPNSDEYLDFTIDFLHKYLKDHSNGTFILCTSYKQVEYIYSNLVVDGFNILKQGTMSRTSLIDRFKDEGKSILIGTDSFWEGVDVKGEKLKNVIIVKLPFVAPDDPIIEAISEKIAKDKKNPFIEYQLPLMITKLKQGIGRLIRSKKDSGDIVILDSRIYSKNYGKSILNSMPSSNIVKI
ncbi:ATP-dependent DNA helicase [Oceanivirga miroungae]|uniref:DNA 5'-3' helicase n=1 Tax=Oceanivirga miroungae TaxID=1130046 RepID=A0A6I8MF49_9FUSO|nr:ATP-dependent DNA helicase [Oceanivirga miroungae]VWL85696.1 helicase c2 [Oceanivirga miroungae]